MVYQELERSVCHGCRAMRQEAIKKELAQHFKISEISLGRVLGSGGFGTVYESYFRGERLAVKKLHNGTKNKRAARESFEAETSVLNFHHPNIVRTLAVTTYMESSYVIMEYAGEKTLQSVMDDISESMGLERRLRFAQDIARALEFAHEQGIAHMDLKPGNVIVTPDDRCKLADFGCCQAVEINDKPASPTKSNLTGTYAYRAPELLRGESPTTKADIYSYGICLWQMMKRERPYGNENQHVVIFRVVADQLRPKLTQETGEEEQYVNLIKLCWQAEAKLRPSAPEIVKQLTEVESLVKKAKGEKLRTVEPLRERLFGVHLCHLERAEL